MRAIAEVFAATRLIEDADAAGKVCGSMSGHVAVDGDFDAFLERWRLLTEECSRKVRAWEQGVSAEKLQVVELEAEMAKIQRQMRGLTGRRRAHYDA